MGISDEIKKIVQSAIKLENDGIRFYTDASNKDIHPLGKAMFKSFIEEEKRHIEKLNGLFSKDADSGGRPPVAQKLEDALGRLERLFKKMYKDGDVIVDPNADDLKAVRTAIDFEKDGNKIYIDAANAANNQAEKEVFALLANEEKAHLTVLENMHKEMEKVYKQEAVNEQRSQVEWERRLFMRPDAQGRKME